MAHHILIHVPAFGQIISTPTFLATHALRDHLHGRGMATGISSLSFPDIAELRAMVMTIWYDTLPHSDYLLFIDADMSFPPEHVVDMVLFNEPVVGTIYRQRKEPVSWAGSGTGETLTQRRGNFIAVEGVGFGCTLIRREVVSTLLAKMPQLVDYRIKLHPAGETLMNAGTNRIIRAFEKLDVPDRGVISEDLSFCIRWRQCGGEVWAHVGSKISHVGPYDYAGRWLDSIEQPLVQQVFAPQPAQLIPLPAQSLPVEINVTTGRDGAPAMSDPAPVGLEERRLEAAE